MKEICIAIFLCITQLKSNAEISTVQFTYYNASDTTVINQLLDKSFDYISSNLDSTYLLAHIALSMSEKAHFNRGVGTAFMRLGVVMNSRGENDSALLYFRSALCIRKNLKDKKLIAYALLALSNVYRHLGIKDSAFYYQFLSIKLNEETGDSIAIANSYTTLGNLYNEYNDSINSLIYYTRSLRIYENMHDTGDVALGYSGLGYYYLKIHRNATSLNYFLNAAQLDEKSGNSEVLSSDYNNIALCYKGLNNSNKALIYYRKALIFAQNKNEAENIAIAFSNIGLLYLDTIKIDNAIFYLLRGLELSKEISDRDLELQNYKSLSDAFAQKGDFKNAFDYHKKYSALNDSILNKDKIDAIGEMQAKYETAQKDTKIKLLDQQSKIDQTHRNELIGGLIASAFIVILLLVVGLLRFNSIKLKRKLEKQIAIADERRRISIEMHDDLGSGLSKISLLSDLLNRGIKTPNDEQYLKNISESSKEMVDKMGNIVWALNTNYDKADNLIAYISLYAREFFESTPIQCEIIQPENMPYIFIAGEIRRNIFLTVKEALHNVLKHSKATSVVITISLADNFLKISIRDNGKGIATTEITTCGNGLRNMKNRMEGVDGSFKIFNHDGTTIELSLPVSA